MQPIHRLVRIIVLFVILLPLALPAADAPTARMYHSMIWTGNELTIWGGDGSNGSLSDGRRLAFAPLLFTYVPLAMR